MLTSIGGYFELELRGGEHYHKGSLRLNSARSCLEYVLRVRQYRKVFIPYYTCEIVLQPFQLLNIDYEFYHINEALEPVELPDLKDGEAFLFTNYFGLKQACVERLAQRYGKQLIVDNAQAFFRPLRYQVSIPSILPANFWEFLMVVICIVTLFWIWNYPRQSHTIECLIC